VAAPSVATCAALDCLHAASQHVFRQFVTEHAAAQASARAPLGDNSAAPTANATARIRLCPRGAEFIRRCGLGLLILQ
jgi:hypothetical protein